MIEHRQRHAFVASGTAATGQRQHPPTPSRQCRSYKVTTLAKLLQHAENHAFVASGTAATGQRQRQPTPTPSPSPSPSRRCRSYKTFSLLGFDLGSSKEIWGSPGQINLPLPPAPRST